MPGFLDVTIVGDDAGVQAMLMHMNSALAPQSLGVFLSTVVDPYLRTRARARFDSEGDDVVGKWAPLKDSTRNIRQSMGYGADGPINRRTGRLEQYILGSPNKVTMHTAGATLVWPGTRPSGETADKLRTAQMGKPMPSTVPRPVLGINERDLAAVLTGLSLHIQGEGFL